MKTLKYLLAIFILLGVVIAGFIYLGFYNVGADVPHYRVNEAFIDYVKERSVSARAFMIGVPADLNSEARVRRGAGNYDAMCVHCHLAPGMENTEIREGLYPRPPNLSKHADDPAEQFWVIRHGIKMTGMPSWRKAGVDDETIWDMVALLQALPKLNEEQYRTLVQASEGHGHPAPAGKPAEEAAKEPSEKPAVQDTATESATKKEEPVAVPPVESEQEEAPEPEPKPEPNTEPDQKQGTAKPAPSSKAEGKWYDQPAEELLNHK